MDTTRKKILKSFRIFGILVMLISFLNFPSIAKASTDITFGSSNSILTIDSSKLSAYKNGVLTEVTEGSKFDSNSGAKLEVKWHVSDSSKIAAGDSVTIPLPTQYLSIGNISAKPLAANGNTIGTYKVSNGQIILTFDENAKSYLSLENGFVNVSGYIQEVEKETVVSNTGVIGLPSFTINPYVPPVDTGITARRDYGYLTKSGGQSSNSSNIYWYLLVGFEFQDQAMETGTISNLGKTVLVDKLSVGQKVSNISFTSYIPYMTQYNKVSNTDIASLNMTFDKLIQKDNETYNQFYSRIEEQPGSYGIYTDDEGTQTVLVGLGDYPGGYSPSETPSLQELIAIVNSNTSLTEAEKTNSLKGLNNLYNATNGTMFTALNVNINTTVAEDTPTQFITNEGELFSNKQLSFNDSTKFEYETIVAGVEGILPGNLKITKTDDSSNPLEGVKFKLQKQQSDGTFTDYATNDGNNERTTDAKGQVSYTGLPVGTYKIVETEGIEGYGAPEYKINNVNGATFTVKTSDNKGFQATVINPKTQTPETVDVTGAKTWDDSDNKNKARPESITVHLFANGQEIKSKTVTAADGWKYAFTDLAKNDKDGKAIDYTITEDAVKDYTSEVTGYDITNTYAPETVDVSGTKTWDDSDNENKARPESITVHLFANGQEIKSKAVTAADGWKYAFTDLDKNDKDGKAIDYTITEDAVKDYTSEVKGYDITNTYAPETVDVTGTKTWDDANNQDGKRPSSITVNLLSNGVVKETKTVTAADDWKYTFTDLPKYENGQEITYTVNEEQVTDYTTTMNGYDITNAYAPETVDVTGTKTWDDANNQDGKRPSSITVTLLSNGVVKETKTVTAADDWKYDFADLDKYKDGQEINYTIEEVKVDGYSSEVKGNDITNTHEVEKTSVKGMKTWNDADNQDGKRPESITVNLLADGKQVASKEVTAADDWKYNFTNLDKYKAGEEIKYTIEEVKVDGYSSEVKGNDITNTHEVEKTSVKGMKTWNDADNQDGKRPESITVNLLADGKQVASKEVTAADDWKYNFTNLDKYKDGEEVTYTITENSVADYTVAMNGYDLTNTYTPGKTSITVTKAWDDKNNQDGLRPDSIQVQLYADGKAKGDPITLTKDMNWMYIWSDLDLKASGKDIVYTVKEVNVPKGYTSKVNTDQSGNMIITNTHTVETTTPVTPNNNSKGSLPRTGSDSGNLFEALGASILAALAGLFLFYKKKRA